MTKKKVMCSLTTSFNELLTEEDLPVIAFQKHVFGSWVWFLIKKTPW